MNFISNENRNKLGDSCKKQISVKRFFHMESIATLTLFMPIIFPIAMSVGIDPIVLGVLVTVVIGVGLVTPPVGMCIYVACDLMHIRVGDTMKYLGWFILGTFVCIAILIACPALITMPGMLMG